MSGVQWIHFRSNTVMVQLKVFANHHPYAKAILEKCSEMYRVKKCSNFPRTIIMLQYLPSFWSSHYKILFWRCKKNLFWRRVVSVRKKLKYLQEKKTHFKLFWNTMWSEWTLLVGRWTNKKFLWWKRLLDYIYFQVWSTQGNPAIFLRNPFLL